MTVHALVVGAGGFPETVLTEEDLAEGRIPLGPLTSVAEAVPRVARALDALGVRVAGVLSDPRLEDWESAWRRVRREARRDPVIVHFSGHGLCVGEELYLAVMDTDPRDEYVHESAVDVSALLRNVDKGSGGPVLFLLDVCHAGAALHPPLLAQLARLKERKAWVIAACPADDTTHSARFSEATATVLDELRQGRLFVSSSLPYVPVEVLAARIDEVMAREDRERGEPKQDVVRTADDTAVLPPPPFLANPHHRSRPSDAYLAHLDSGLEHFRGVLAPELDVVHFAERAAGGRGVFRFSGRTAQLRRLREWLDGTPQDGNRPSDGTAPDGNRPSEGAAPDGNRPSDGTAPDQNRPPDGTAPDQNRPSDGTAPDQNRPSDGTAPDQNQPPDGTAPDQNQPPDGTAPDGNRPPDGTAPDGNRPSDGAARAGERLLVVTGSPGSGKSALLGVVVCTVHPELQALRARLALRTFRPRPDPRLLAVHARGLTTPQVVRSLHRQILEAVARSAGMPAPEPMKTVESAELFDTLARAGGATVVVDALDEADDPEELLREVVLPLAGHPDPATAPGCRVLLGTRLWRDTLPDLRAALEGRPELLIDLDRETPQALADDLGAYLEQLLDPLCPPETAHELAQRLACSNTYSHFLTAYLYGTHLRERHAASAPMTPEEAVAGLPLDLPGMLDLNLRTLRAEDPWTGPVLAALGRVAGAGMPLELLHAVAVELAQEDPGPVPRRPSDTERALDRARFHLRRTSDDGRHLYRFFHQALAERMAPHARPEAVLRALLAKVPVAGGVRDWAAADPYLRRHAADHAADAGPEALDALLADPGYLLHADPERLAPHLHRARGERARRHADVYRQTTAHHPLRHSVTARRDLLALEAAVWRDAELASALAEATGPAEPLVRPLWALSRTAAAARLHTLGPHDGPVTRVLFTSVPGEATPVLVTAGPADRARRWDPLRGTPLGEPQAAAGTVHDPGAVQGLGAARGADGRPLVISVCEAGIAVHDAGTGALRHMLPPADGTVGPLLATLTLPEGGARAVTAGAGRVFQVWDVDAGRRLFERDSGMTDVRALVAGTLPDRRPVVLAAGDEYAARAWDLRTGRLLFRLGPHADFVLAAALTRRTDGGAAAVTAGLDQRVHVWDLSDGQGRPLHTLSGHRDWVTALAAGRAGGRCLAVSGDRQGRLLVWDLDAGRAVGELPGGLGVIRCVALYDDGAAGLVVAGCDDGRVAVWELGRWTRTHAFAAHPGGARTLAVTRAGDRVLLATGGADGRAVVWDVTPEDTTTGREDAEGADGAGGARATVDGGPSGTASDDRGGGVRVTAGRGPVAARIAGHRAGDRVPGHGGPGAERAVGHSAVALCAPGAGPVLLLGVARRGLEVREFVTGEHLHRRDLPAPVPWGRAVAAAELPGLGPVAVTAGRDGAVRTWDLRTGEHLHTVAGVSRRSRALAVAALPDGRPVAVTGEDDMTVGVRELTTGILLARFPGHTGRLLSLTVLERPGAPPGAVSADDAGAVLVWDLATGSEIAAPSRSGPPVHGVAVAELPCGTALVLAGGDDGEVRVWDVDAPQAVRHLTGLENRVNALAATRRPDGTTVAVGGGEDGLLAFWDVATGAELGPPCHLPGPVSGLAACPAGCAVAHASGTAALRWTEQPPVPVPAPRAPASARGPSG
ncbi:hypothetical protein ACFQE4_29780 [Streptomyces thermocoprophilus]|uniref:Nephrocystin 3-like N-terminal domain-containing protein n=1 Tax=Streptomyces thermocoprophilus TaxID=78356 RepID=A0ABV5V7J2_9ACTN